ncbi:hypothetical protein I316_06865 [Kwoniella heveanensis BCC8398]|uniref:Uncharacterized protein n=1 Tax=Kwoniella heveanensis BCC8398 TaxID=1296120 RepID=A0A1B9GKI5_9TREE|nr:hypothetical protein I316_06865 [Kwoniella heveanensis BCC8398]
MPSTTQQPTLDETLTAFDNLEGLATQRRYDDTYKPDDQRLWRMSGKLNAIPVQVRKQHFTDDEYCKIKGESAFWDGFWGRMGSQVAVMARATATAPDSTSGEQSVSANDPTYDVEFLLSEALLPESLATATATDIAGAETTKKQKEAWLKDRAAYLRDYNSYHAVEGAASGQSGAPSAHSCHDVVRHGLAADLASNGELAEVIQRAREKFVSDFVSIVPATDAKEVALAFTRSGNTAASRENRFVHELKGGPSAGPVSISPSVSPQDLVNSVGTIQSKIDAQNARIAETRSSHPDWPTDMYFLRREHSKFGSKSIDEANANVKGYWASRRSQVRSAIESHWKSHNAGGADTGNGTWAPDTDLTRPLTVPHTITGRDRPPVHYPEPGFEGRYMIPSGLSISLYPVSTIMGDDNPSTLRDLIPSTLDIHKTL